MERVAVCKRLFDWNRVADAAVQEVIAHIMLNFRDERHGARCTRSHKRRFERVLFKPNGLAVRTVHRAGQKARILLMKLVPVEKNVLFRHRAENIIKVEHRVLCQKISRAHIVGVPDIVFNDLSAAPRLARYVRKRVRCARRNADNIRKQQIFFHEHFHHAATVIAAQAAAL